MTRVLLDYAAKYCTILWKRSQLWLQSMFPRLAGQNVDRIISGLYAFFVDKLMAVADIMSTNGASSGQMVIGPIDQTLKRRVLTRSCLMTDSV